MEFVRRIVLFSVVFVQLARCDDDIYRSCRKAYTYGYGYQTVYHVTDNAHVWDKSQLYLEFYVKTKSNAHILLSPNEKLVADSDPVYEIVLGGGRNTFSEIRRVRRFGSVARQQTNDIVAENEFKGFWLRLNYTSKRLEVGKKDEPDPFIFYTDPQVMFISYFSFCTWTSILGDWLFACTHEQDAPEVSAVEGDVVRTSYDNLIMDAFANSDPYVLPVLNENSALNLNMYLQLHHVDFDERKLSFNLEGVLHLTWRNEKINWKPEKYENTTNVHVRAHEVWIPSLYHFYSATGTEDLYTSYPLINAKYDGNMSWSPTVSLSSWCTDISIDNWPHDRHICHILLGSYVTSQPVTLNIRDVELTDLVTSTSQWDIQLVPPDTLTNYEIERGYEVETHDDSDDKIAVVLEFNLKRHQTPLGPLLWTPFIAVCTMILASFWLSPTDSTKLLLNCINLIVLVIHLLHLSNLVPVMNSVPRILSLCSCGTLLVCVPILLTVMLKNAPRLEMPHKIVYILDCLAFCLPSTTQGQGSYGKLKEGGGDNECLTHFNPNKEINYTYLLIILVERLAFVVYLLLFLFIMSF